MKEHKAVLVLGAGDATGGAIARRFAREDYIACVTRRHADKLAPLVARIEAAGGRAQAYASDARKEDEVIALFAQILWRPMLLGGVFKATDNHSPVDIPAKGKWLHQDLQRWAKRYGAVFRNNPHFPVNTLVLMRGATGLQMRGTDFDRYVEAVFRAMWEEPRNLGDPAEIAALPRQAGFDAEAFLALANDAEVKQQLKRNTEEAVARGVFGAPTFFVGDEMFWGQDRLDFVAEALA